MRTLDEPGWYVDALPSNEYVRLIPGSHLETHRGRVELPGANVLYLDLAADGIRFCGVGHQPPVEDTALEWNGGQWIPHGKTVGPRSVIFDATGHVLTVPAAGLPAGSQGYRQVADDGRIVLGDEAYADTARGVWEYTTRGDITVGQSGKGPHGEDAVIALYRGKRYVLAEGQCRFIKFRRQGDDLAISWVDEIHRQSCIRWLTVAELLTFPEQRFDAPVPVPVPTPTPTPEPHPVPENIDRYLVDRSDVVDAVKRDYPHLKGGAIVDQVAHRLNREHRFDPIRYGRKARQADGGNPNEDALTFRLDLNDNSKKKLIDILVDGGGRDGTTWDVRPAHEEPGNGFWRPAVNPDLDGLPVPDPGEPGLPKPPKPAGSIDAAVRSLIEATVASLRAELNAVTATVKALEQKVAEVDSRPVAPFPNRIALRSDHGKFVAAEPDGTLIATRDSAGPWETFSVEVKN